MLNPTELKHETIGIINSALTILEKYPNMDDENINHTFSKSLNPFVYLMDLFKHTVGYDKFLDIFSKGFYDLMPILETSVKAIIIANLKNLVSCDLNPFISKKILREGVILDLRALDIMNMLSYSPLTYTNNLNTPPITDKILEKHEVKEKINPGKFYYFGCDDMECADDLINAKDFNAFLWYIKNRPNTREVWLGSNKDYKRTPSEDRKQNKNDGIVTLEYSGVSQNLTDSEGNPMFMQTPCNSCLHVFIGNTKEIEEQEKIKIDESLLVEYEKLQKDVSEYINFLNDELEYVKISSPSYNISDAEHPDKEFEIQNYSFKSEKDEKIENLNYDIDVLNALLKSINQIKREEPNLKYIEIPFVPNSDSVTSGTLIQTPAKSDPEYLYVVGLRQYYTYNTCIATNPYGLEYQLLGDEVYYELRYNRKRFTMSKDAFFSNVDGCKQDIKKTMDSLYLNSLSPHYRDIKKNYYYHKTMLEFNLDFISSIKIFDAKVLLSQVIDALTSCFSIDLQFDIKQKVVKKEVEKMVNDIIENDTTVIDDCFFTFSNEDFETMLRKSEMERIGVYSDDNGISNGKKIDGQEMAHLLNQLSDDAMQEGNIKTITETLVNVSEYITEPNKDEKETEYSLNAKVNFIERLLNEFATRVVLTVLTPKLYLLLAINKQLMGEETHLSLTEFIARNKNLLISIIKDIVTQLVNYLTKQILSLLGDLIKQLSFKFEIEHKIYYRELLQKCVECVKLFGGKFGSEGFDLDNVIHADIYDDDNVNKPINTEC